MSRKQTIQRRGFSHKLSDAEAITIEITGEFLGFDTDKAIWEHVKDIGRTGLQSLMAGQLCQTNLWH